MFFNKTKKSLFDDASTSSRQAKAKTQCAAVLSHLTEPSAEIRSAVRRYRLGLPELPYRKSGAWRGPTAYEAIPLHKRASMRAGLASSDALIVTRFQFLRADEETVQLLGRDIDGRGVLDFDLGGLELAWHNDLLRALEDRAAFWSVSRLVQQSGDLVLEHIVLPIRRENGQLSFIGWYHRVGGSLEGDPIWADVIRIERERRGQKISSSLFKAMLPDVAVTVAERQAPGDIISEH